MPDFDPALPTYARPPGHNDLPPGVYVDRDPKIAKPLMKQVKVRINPKKAVPHRKMKRYY